MKNAIEEGKSVSNLLVWVINYSIFCSELAFLLHTIHMQKKKKKKNPCKKAKPAGVWRGFQSLVN